MLLLAALAPGALLMNGRLFFWPCRVPGSVESILMMKCHITLHSRQQLCIDPMHHSLGPAGLRERLGHGALPAGTWSTPSLPGMGCSEPGLCCVPACQLSPVLWGAILSAQSQHRPSRDVLWVGTGVCCCSPSSCPSPALLSWGSSCCFWHPCVC